MMIDKAEWRKLDTLLDRMQNAPDTIFLIGEGMAQMQGNDCTEAQALYYVSDSLKKDLKKLQEYLYAGIRKGDEQEKALSRA